MSKPFMSAAEVDCVFDQPVAGNCRTNENGKPSKLRHRIDRSRKEQFHNHLNESHKSTEISRGSSPCSSPARGELSERTKVKSILRLTQQDNLDTITLKQLSISRGGLINNDIRRKAWHRLLGVDINDILPKPADEVLKGHRDYQQVVMDVNRSLKRFPPGMLEEERLSMQDQLVDCIMRVLVHRPELHYYQGFHDIVVTFLLVVGDDVAFALVNELCKKHLRDFMYENMEKTTVMLHYLYPLLGKASPTLRLYLERTEVGTIFCLPWLITWYGHVLNDIKPIVRLYDFFIACDPLMPIYLAAAIVLHREPEILACEPEMPIIHGLLSRIPDDLPFEYLISRAGDLFVQFPPSAIANEAKAEHNKYVEENQRKQKQLEQRRQERIAREKQQNTSWPFGVKNLPGFGRKPKSVLVQMTVALTGAAVIGAAAFTVFSSYYRGGATDFHWVWGSLS